MTTRNNSFLIRFIILVFACFRLAQFLPNDIGPFGVFQKIRDYTFHRRAGARVTHDYELWNSIYELVHCPFCQGVWIASVLALWLKPKNILHYLIYVFAIAGGQTFLESRQNHD